VNWLAVSKQQRKSSGIEYKEKNWRSLGLGTFLLHLLQVANTAQGWSPNMFLQANFSEGAVKFYNNRGFVWADSNEIKELPPLMQSVAKISSALTVNDVNDKKGFIYFVTTKQQEDELDSNEAFDTKEKKEERKQQFLFLLRLDGKLILTNPLLNGALKKTENGLNLLEFIPRGGDPTQEQIFINFPFTVESSLLDESVKDLFIFGDSRFCFRDAKDYILTLQMPKGFKPRQHPIIKTAAVNVQSYKIVSGENAMEEWMNDNLLNFFKA